MKIPSAVSYLFHGTDGQTNGQTDRQADMAKLKHTFFNFVAKSA
jgi:hypothetical protein